MAFPVVQSTSQNSLSGGSTHVISMPSGIQVGDLLLVFFGTDGDNTIIDSQTFTVLDQQSNNTAAFGAVLYKIATGGDTLTITVSVTNEPSSHIVYRIDGWDSSELPELSTVAQGASELPNSTIVTPSWSQGDTLYIAVEINDRNRTVSLYPANYTGSQLEETGGGSGDCHIGVATRNYNNPSDDPDQWTLSATDQWNAWTIAVAPVGENIAYKDITLKTSLSAAPVLVYKDITLKTSLESIPIYKDITLKTSLSAAPSLGYKDVAIKTSLSPEGVQDTGWVDANVIARVSHGAYDWINESWAKTQNDMYAYVNQLVDDGITYYLRCTDFYNGGSGYNIPEGSTITGIEVRAEGYGSDAPATFNDDDIILRKTSGQIGDDKADAVNWKDSDDDSYKSWGGSSDTWNAGLVRTDVNSADFGFDISLQNKSGSTKSFNMDHIQIKIYYIAGETTAYKDVSLKTTLESALTYKDITLKTTLESIPIYKDITLKTSLTEFVYVDYKDVALKTTLHSLDYKDVTLKTSLESANIYKDITLKTSITSSPSYKDIALKTSITSNNTYKDITLKTTLDSLDYKDVALKTTLNLLGYKDVTIKVSFELGEVLVYKDIALKTSFTSALTYKDITLKTTLDSLDYKDIVLKTSLESALTYKDIALKTTIESIPNYKDIALKISLISPPNYKDITLKTSLESAPTYKDISLKVSLESAITFKDISLKTTLDSLNYKDITLKTSLEGIGYKDIALKTSLRLSEIEGFKDITLKTSFTSVGFKDISIKVSLETIPSEIRDFISSITRTRDFISSITRTRDFISSITRTRDFITNN